MRSCKLGNTGLISSALGFGCSGIMGRVGRRESLRALAAAWDAGVTFYDTARSYGYGESEAVLGEFLQGRRGRAIVSTKFGILAGRQPFWKRAAKPIVRTVLSAVPSARGAVQKRIAREFTANRFTVAVLEQSLHESLRKLKTDYVDLLFLHQAEESVLERAELFSAIEKMIAAGKVRVAGISAEPQVIVAATGKHLPAIQAAQFSCNLFDLSAAGAGAAAAGIGWAGVANHPFRGVGGVQACRRLLADTAAAAPVELREKLADARGNAFPDAVLNLILASPGIDVVIPAMMNPGHIRVNAAAIEQSQFSSAELDWLRTALTAAQVPVANAPTE